MIISHEHKYVFINVPSTGSTAISAELRDHYGGERILRKHSNYTEFRKFVGADFKQYFVFATTRNPLDLLVTYFLKLKGNHKGQYTEPKFWLRNGGFVPDQQLREYDYIAKNDADFSEFFLKFQRAIYHNWFLVGHTNFNYIMNYENLADEFARVVQKIGLTPVRALPRVNPTKLKAGGFEEHYRQETIEPAIRYFGPFMQKWGYDFPDSWSAGAVPRSSLIRFRLKEDGVNAAARFLTLDPHSRFVQRVKSIWDSVM